MKKVKLTELSDPVRSFLVDALDADGVTLEDASGRACGGLVPYFEADPDVQQQAWEKLRRVQREVGNVLRDEGVTEQDLLDEILKDD